MVLTSSQINNPPPLDPKFKGAFVWEEEVVEEEVHSVETMTNKGKGFADPEKVEYIKLIQHLFYILILSFKQRYLIYYKDTLAIYFQQRSQGYIFFQQDPSIVS